MKTSTVALILLISLAFAKESFSSISLNQWEAFKASLNKKIVEANALEDFWYGDDGIDCGEPTFKVTAVDFETKLIHLNIQQSVVAYGCAKTAFVCKIRYSLKSNEEIKLETVDLIKDCDF